MFIGHFGIGLGSKRAAPAVSLGILFIAAQFLDLLWPTLLLLGWEHVSIEPGITKMTPLNFTDYPVTHSLLMACVWGALIGLGYFLIKRRYRGAIVLALCVVSHWILDLLVHRPDLQLYPGSTVKVGLGLWNHVPLAIIVEGLVFLAGLVLYLRTTHSTNKFGEYGFWAMIGLLVLIYLANLFGPPPANVKAIAWAGESQWLFVIWAFLVDKYRTIRPRDIPEEPVIAMHA